MPKKVFLLLITFALLGLLVWFEIALHTGENDTWLALQASVPVALAANLGFGVAISAIACVIRWMATLDAADHMLLFGLKVGLVIFIALTIVSVVLMFLGKPPTRAPGGLTVGFFYAFELSGCLEPIYWMWEIFSTSRRKSRGKSAPTGPGQQPPP